MYNPPGAPTGAEIIPGENKIILHLTDGMLGDDDWTENGVIIDPGGPALFAVAPVALKISMLSSTTAQIAWPSPSIGWVLQQNTNGIGSVNWSNVTDSIQDDGTTKTLLVSPPKGSRIYRLFKP
jgi:hypothetical protein